MGKSGYYDDAASKIRKLTLPDGFQVGIANLDAILREVDGLKLTDHKAIKKELLARVKACNFVASGAENDYSSALFEEYRLKYLESGSDKKIHRVEAKNHNPG